MDRLWEQYERELAESEPVEVATAHGLRSVTSPTVLDEAPIPSLVGAAAHTKGLFGWVTYKAVRAWVGGPSSDAIGPHLESRVLHGESGASVPGERLLEAAEFERKPWRSLSKMEKVLDQDDDHSAITLRLITLAEATTRGLLWRGSDAILDDVLGQCRPSKARFLQRVVEEGRGMTLCSLAAWVSELEKLALHEHDAVLHYLSARIAHPRWVVSHGRLAETLGSMISDRNALAHGELEHASAARHRQICSDALGRKSLAKWWKKGCSGPEPSVVLLLLARAALLEKDTTVHSGQDA